MTSGTWSGIGTGANTPCAVVRDVSPPAGTPPTPEHAVRLGHEEAAEIFDLAEGERFEAEVYYSHNSTAPKCVRFLKRVPPEVRDEDDWSFWDSIR